MTLEKVFKEMEQYNNISRACGNDELKFYFTDFFTHEFKKFSEFKKWLNEELVEEVVDVVLNGEYDFMPMVTGECSLRFVFDGREEYITMCIET